MKVRLVVYRKETSSSTSTTAFDLDLQEEPNVALNYQFSDIKEPATRKASYSQTFKLPFTDRNNEFFQNWYNVNLDTLVFSSRTKFEAVLYVGTTPQFEGYLQLKSVYKKAQLYEAVLMSNTATLFSTIGEQRLKDVFKEDDGSYNTNFNHVFNETNFENSWGVGITSISGALLYDSTIGISRIVYPLSVTRPNFYYNPANDRYLRMDQTSANTIVTNDGVEAAYNKSVSLSQFRPALQIRTLLNMIIARAGFTYTSSFLDSADFGKIFMTTCNHLELPTVPTTNSSASLGGFMNVASSVGWGVYTDDFTSMGAGVVLTNLQYVVPNNIVDPPTSNCPGVADPDDLWNTTYNYFTKSDSSMENLQFSTFLKTQAIEQTQNPGSIDFLVEIVKFDTSTNTSTDDIISWTTQEIQTATTTVGGVSCQAYEDWIIFNLDISNMAVGSSAQVRITSTNLQWTPGTVTPIFEYAGLPSVNNFQCTNVRSAVNIEWAGYANDIYGATVDIPSCIDPEITQKAFLKDLIQRFNLVIVTDPSDDTNLLIEPYADFIASGQIKDWTNKLDTSKEIVVADTTQIQKKTIHLTDQEDEDLYNKSIKENYPDVNVFGHLKIDQFNNDFATGELKNESIFSPFINGKVFLNENEQAPSFLRNMTVHYEFTYEQGSGGVVENKMTKTKPKLFWYNGEATYTQNALGNTTDYYLHRTTSSGVTAFDFNSYPVCTPFNIVPGDGSNPANQYSLTAENTSLYWNAVPPIVGNLTVFNYAGTFGSWFNNTLYGKYWKPYLDNIYSTEARIMECHLNLNEVDIFNFSFADEIFIKDTYWRILNISNYQVGEKASTKVKLIKSLDSKENCAGCDYVLSSSADSNLYGLVYTWCPDDEPDCTPDVTSGSMLGVYASPECCACNGGWTMYNMTSQASNGLYPCVSLAGSLPIILKSVFGTTSLFNSGQLKTLLNDKIGGLNRPKITGTANDKYATPILPYYGDDMVIKYKNKSAEKPAYDGESHKLILAGYTEGNTRGYAYPQNDSYSTELYMPPNVNIAIRLTGISSVVGGTSATYTLGSTETFGYYTAFVILPDRTVQMGTAGGVEEFSIREGANPTTCTMHIDIDSEGLLRFGLDDSQTDTKRTWNITAEIEINRIGNLSIGFDENWALFQNGQKIKFQNGDYLIWN